MQYGDLLAEQLTSDEHIIATPDLAMLVNEFGLDFAMAFQILRPRLNAEFDRAKGEEKAAVQKRLAAEKQALIQRIASPIKEVPTLLPLPASPSTNFDHEDTGDTIMEDGREDGLDSVDGVALIPPPKSATVRHIRAATLLADDVQARQKVWWPSALTLTMQQARSMLPQEVNDIMR